MILLKHAGVLAAALLRLINAAPIPDEIDPLDVSDKYIITLKPSTNMASHLSFVQGLHAQSVQETGKPYRGADQQYFFADFKAYAGHFSASTISTLRTHPDVEAIEPDQLWTTFELVDEKHATEGLNLISHKKDEHSSDYLYDSNGGKGTYGYVVDTGINLKHRDFQGRASKGYNAVRGKRFEDRVGHGTHVAGTIGSKTYGVAKKCKLIAVKVFDGESGSTSSIMEGYNWAVRDILRKRRQAKAAINMSLGGGYSEVFNSAVNKAFAKGVTTVVAAGNSNSDAAQTSPASAKGAITVAATDMDRVRAPFSNYGKVVSVFGPGVGILSTWIGSDTATKKISGTSMACPHITGLALYLKSLKGGALRDAKATKEAVEKGALKDAVKDAHGSPAVFAYNGSGK